jgi:hypothetical protein
MTQRARIVFGIVALGTLLMVLSACRSADNAKAGPANSKIAARTKGQNIELGRQHKTAAELYQSLLDEAKGGPPLTATSLPNWTGVYSRPADKGFTFDPDQPDGGLPTAKLTPEFQAKLLKRIDDVKHGIEWDPISTCSPPGMPRWLTEPFLREFVVTPDQTWLINEMVNDIRRIYTDGRKHVPEDDRVPIPNGDSIGFWDGPQLVIHTNMLQAGIYQRSNPDYTNQVETVEIWKKIDDKNMGADVWVYDPPALAEPWYVKQVYVKLDDSDKSLRIRYWNCGENPNNSVVQTKDGTTAFRNLNFGDNAETKKGKP